MALKRPEIIHLARSRKKGGVCVCVCVPVIAKIVSEDAQQRVSKLCHSSTVVLDPSQVVKQRLGGKMHLDGSSGEQQHEGQNSGLKHTDSRSLLGDSYACLSTATPSPFILNKM